MRYARMGLMVLAVAGLMAAGACDDDTRDKAKETAESAKGKAGEAGARGAAPRDFRHIDTTAGRVLEFTRYICPQ